MTIHLKTFKIDEGQLRSVTEIAPKPPFPCENRSPICKCYVSMLGVLCTRPQSLQGFVKPRHTCAIFPLFSDKDRLTWSHTSKELNITESLRILQQFSMLRVRGLACFYMVLYSSSVLSVVDRIE